uniref:Uncharacterized protein n=1 Tax=Anguilla anguilla TaxID=7936 RepID=A0A0E9UFR4_ANGAN
MCCQNRDFHLWPVFLAFSSLVNLPLTLSGLAPWAPSCP